MADIVTADDSNVPEGFAVVEVGGKKRLASLSLPITPDGKAASLSPTSVDGALLAVPSGSANGTVLPGRPDDAGGVILYLGSGDSVTYAIETTQPSSVPANTLTIAGSAYAQWTEPLGPMTNVYVTAKTGTPKFRFV